MKKYFTTLVAILVISSSAASAVDHYPQNNGFYVGGKLGPAFYTYKYLDCKKKYPVDFFGSVATGYKFYRGLRLEGEGSLRTHTLKSTLEKREEIHVNIWALAANMYYDFDLDWCIQPYIGVGVGHQFVTGEISLEAPDNSKYKIPLRSKGENFYQTMIGANYHLSHDVDISAEYRKINDNYNHAVTLGVKKFF